MSSSSIVLPPPPIPPSPQYPPAPPQPLHCSLIVLYNWIPWTSNLNRGETLHPFWRWNSRSLPDLMWGWWTKLSSPPWLREMNRTPSAFRSTNQFTVPLIISPILYLLAATPTQRWKSNNPLFSPERIFILFYFIFCSFDLLLVLPYEWLNQYLFKMFFIQ